MPLFFTYGSLRKGQFNHSFLLALKPVFKRTAQIKADMVDLRLPFPAIKEGFGLVEGEIYEVDKHGFAELDLLEGHPHFYERRTVTTTDGDAVEVYFGTGVLYLQAKPLSTEG